MGGVEGIEACAVLQLVEMLSACSRRHAAGADATTAETYGNQAESEDEERAFKTKGSKKAQENGAISFKIGLFEGSLDIDGDKYW